MMMLAVMYGMIPSAKMDSLEQGSTAEQVRKTQEVVGVACTLLACLDERVGSLRASARVRRAGRSR